MFWLYYRWFGVGFIQLQKAGSFLPVFSDWNGVERCMSAGRRFFAVDSRLMFLEVVGSRLTVLNMDSGRRLDVVNSELTA